MGVDDRALAVANLATLGGATGRSVAWPGFRLFDALPTEPDSPGSRRRRRSNAFAIPPFDPHSSTLFDYPTILSSRRGGDWRRHNTMATVQVRGCPLDCWHCYDEAGHGSEGTMEEWIGPEGIAAHFGAQRALDAMAQRCTDVLRVSGGEPFLFPHFVVGCARKVLALARRAPVCGEPSCRDPECSAHVSVWTETNLLPFVGSTAPARVVLGEAVDADRGIAEVLTLHPCLHGADAASAEEIAGQGATSLSLDAMADALRFLVECGIEVYPTFHPNCVPPRLLRDLAHTLAEVHPNLPLRVALVPVDLSYSATRRQMERRASEPGPPPLYPRDTGIQEWDRIIRSMYGVGYAALPRHMVPLSDGPTLLRSPAAPLAAADEGPAVGDDDRRIYLLKSAARPEYKQQVMAALAYPDGWTLSVPYDEKWVQDDVATYAASFDNGLDGTQAVIAYAPGWTPGDDPPPLLMPLREASVTRVECPGGIVRLSYSLGCFLTGRDGSRAGLSAAFTGQTAAQFGEGRLAPTGSLYAALGSRVPAAVPAAVDIERTWEDTVRELVGHSRFKKTLFLRITHLDGADGTGQRSEVRLMAGERASLVVRWYAPEGVGGGSHPPEVPVLRVETSEPAVVAVAGPATAQVSKYGHLSVTLAAGEPRQDAEATVTVHVAGCDAPRLVIPVVVAAAPVLARVAKEVAPPLCSLVVGGMLGQVPGLSGGARAWGFSAVVLCAFLWGLLAVVPASGLAAWCSSMGRRVFCGLDALLPVEHDAQAGPATPHPPTTGALDETHGQPGRTPKEGQPS